MTLVSHANEFVFLKTRKTGGSSVEMLLEPYCAPPEHEVVHATEGCISQFGIVGVRVSPRRIRELKDAGRMPQTIVRGAGGEEVRINWISHMPAKKVRMAVGAEAWSRYARITAVRNPFTRAVSLFYHRMRTSKLDPTLDLSDTRSAFREFVLSDDFTSDEEVTHIDGEPVFDDAFRLEHLKVDIPRIGERLGLPLEYGQLAHVKKRATQGSPLPDRELFGPEVADAIRVKSAWVFDHFGYSRDWEEARL